ncbi:MAG TPA: hypothetical protein DDZ88_17290 [Verrucomicrobiales bacterium]|nr:hypothetical protein [Verrucomicrobiales bacterium]
MKTLTLTTLLLLSNACLADVDGFSRATKFASPEQFLQVARSFHPATKPSELGYIFSAPERGNDQSRYGKTIFAETITKVTELSREPDLCAYFLQAEPPTNYTRSYVAALFLLRPGDNGIWRITTIERFQAVGAGGWVECKVILKPKQSKDSTLLIFQVTETDAGRHDVLEERVYKLAAGHGIRLKPVK